jgi:MoaA/NifB/PqqE/SkfB family radical SAM enzyme
MPGNLSDKVPVTDPRRIFDPRTLGFRLTYRCKSKCEHCYCYTDKDDLAGVDLRFEDIEPLIPQAKAIGMSGIGLSGGEPFLLKDTVYAIVECAKRHGLNVNLASNAFWAKQSDKAVNILEHLKSLGFQPPRDSIAVSAGQFHLPYIDRACSMHLIKAYRQVFDATLPRLDFEYVLGNEQILHDYKAYLAENGVAEGDYKLVERTIFQSTGNSRIANETIIAKRPASVFRALCPWVKDLIVDPAGNVYPCCGFNRYNKGIVIGNIHEQSIEAIRNAAQVNPVMVMLKYHSFAHLHSLLQRQFDLPAEADGLCDICEVIFADPRHVDYLVNRFSHLYAF